MFGVVFASVCVLLEVDSPVKHFKMAPKAHKQKQTQHQTQGKSVLYFSKISYLEHIL